MTTIDVVVWKYLLLEVTELPLSMPAVKGGAVFDSQEFPLRVRRARAPTCWDFRMPCWKSVR
ncbi:MAG: hypothetical protein IPG92_16555 [Flavobacteriales bacterium]|nr:hypothetical protein [Flavobacteriales bacterium]